MYRRGVSAGAVRDPSQSEQMRGLVPVLALVIAIVAAFTDPTDPFTLGDALLGAVVVGAFAAWTYRPGVPLALVGVVVLVPVVLMERTGELEPMLFEATLFAFVVGRWAAWPGEAIALGLLALASPVAVSLIQDPAEIALGIWFLGIVFPWIIGRAAARQQELALELEATRAELAKQALVAERRQIARDIHDVVGHGIAALMLQITSARHVLRRDPAAAEEALRSAEDAGRRNMRELRRTVAVLRRDEDEAAAPLPSAGAIPALIEDARSGGLSVELRSRGDLARVAPSVGAALYRITQEALANATRHAPHARTVFEVEVANGRASLTAATTGPTTAPVSEGPGYGLIGMRERAIGLGGDFDAGPTQDGWLVSCRLPLQADAEAAGAEEARDR
jgi:signal transduction histidine kinase